MSDAAKCVMCRTRNAPQPLDYCPGCSLVARLEFSRGIRRLEAYLAAHAAFDAWDAAR